MNFTYLVDAARANPDSADLARYAYFLIIFVLSDEAEQFIHEEIGLELSATDKALCWIVQPRHMGLAPRGSALRRLYDLLKEKGLTQTEHSFVAWVSKDELLRGNASAGKFIHLNLQAYDDPTVRRRMLTNATREALREMHPSPALARLAKQLPYVSVLVRELVKLTGG